MLKGSLGGKWRSIKNCYMGQQMKLVVATPDGIKKIEGKLCMFDYPSDILLKEVPLEIIEELRNPETHYESMFSVNGLYGLDVNRRAWYDGGPEDTIRAHFTNSKHAIKSIEIFNKTIYEASFIGDTYGPLDIEAERSFRKEHGLPIAYPI